MQLTTVSRRVFSLILERQSNCSSQREPIVKVQEQLGEGLDTFQTGKGRTGQSPESVCELQFGHLGQGQKEFFWTAWPPSGHPAEH